VRRRAGLWPLGRSTESGPRAKCQARTDEGELFEGVNFASQDYLSLSSHPAVLETAIETMREFGVHSAGSPALVGNTSLSLALERKIGDFLGMGHVSLFSTGWARAINAQWREVKSGGTYGSDYLRWVWSAG